MGKASRTKRDRPPWSRDPAMAALAARLRGHEAVVEEHCPGGVAELEELRANRRREPGAWPGWCWLPTGFSDELVKRRSPTGLSEQTQLGVGEAMAFVAAWRQGKGIYKVSPEFAEELHATSMPDALPSDVLLQFPEWCAYLALSPAPDLVGAYVRLDWDQDAERPALGLLFDIAPHAEPRSSVLVGFGVPLGQPSLSAALSELMAEGDEAAEDATGDVLNVAKAIRPFVELALYLCSVDADAVERRNKASKPQRSSGPPLEPRVWDVGYRVADLLRRPGGSHVAESPGSGPTLSPHLRRAHWHTYLLGKGSRADPSKARRELRWVHPTLVGTGDRTPVVRRVR